MLHASQLIPIIISMIESQVLHVEKRPLLKESPSTSRNDSEEEEVIEVESEEEVEVMPEEVIGVHVGSGQVIVEGSAEMIVGGSGQVPGRKLKLKEMLVSRSAEASLSSSN